MSKNIHTSINDFKNINISESNTKDEDICISKVLAIDIIVRHMECNSTY